MAAEKVGETKILIPLGAATILPKKPKISGFEHSTSRWLRTSHRSQAAASGLAKAQEIGERIRVKEKAAWPNKCMQPTPHLRLDHESE